MKTANPWYLALVTLIVAGGAPAAQDPAQLSVPEKWVLASWTAEVEIPEATLRRPSISFGKGKFQGTTGVNHMDGRYTAKAEGGMVLSLLAMTEMAGDPAAMKMEGTFTKLLEGVSDWKVEDKTLILSDGTPDLELRFQVPAPAKALPLVGTKWTLQGIEKTEGETVSFTALVRGTTITLTIGDDDRATGSAGVNRYFGGAKLGEADKITFGRMASTRRGGPPAAMAQERDYLKQLEAVSNWTVKDKRLVLTDAAGSFSLIYEAK